MFERHDEPRDGRRAGRRQFRPACDPLEGRALLSQVGSAGGVRAAQVARLAREVRPAAITTDPAGVAAVLAALRGGPGSEFVQLIRRQVPNYGRIISQFVSGRRTEFGTPGFFVKLPKTQPAYTGPVFDQIIPTAAGALLQRNGDLELGAILRGPIDQVRPSYYVFGINRGAAPAAGPFAGRPGIRYDALVTVAWGVNGAGATATVVDQVSGATTAIDPSRIRIEGPTLRVYVPGALLPSQGLAPSRYQFAFWTRTALDGGVEQVGDFLPGNSTLRVGVVPGRRR